MSLAVEAVSRAGKPEGSSRFEDGVLQIQGGSVTWLSPRAPHRVLRRFCPPLPVVGARWCRMRTREGVQRCLCMLHEADCITVAPETGASEVVVTPCRIDDVFPLEEGVLLVRADLGPQGAVGDRDSAAAAMPSLFSLTDPLDELKPVALVPEAAEVWLRSSPARPFTSERSSVLGPAQSDFFADSLDRPVALCPVAKLLLTFSLRARVHTLWHLEPAATWFGDGTSAPGLLNSTMGPSPALTASMEHPSVRASRVAGPQDSVLSAAARAAGEEAHAAARSLYPDVSARRVWCGALAAVDGHQGGDTEPAVAAFTSLLPDGGVAVLALRADGALLSLSLREDPAPLPGIRFAFHPVAATPRVLASGVVGAGPLSLSPHLHLCAAHRALAARDGASPRDTPDPAAHPQGWRVGLCPFVAAHEAGPSPGSAGRLRVWHGQRCVMEVPVQAGAAAEGEPAGGAELATPPRPSPPREARSAGSSFAMDMETDEEGGGAGDLVPCEVSSEPSPQASPAGPAGGADTGGLVPPPSPRRVSHTYGAFPGAGAGAETPVASAPSTGQSTVYTPPSKRTCRTGRGSGREARQDDPMLFRPSLSGRGSDRFRAQRKAPHSHRAAAARQRAGFASLLATVADDAWVPLGAELLARHRGPLFAAPYTWINAVGGAGSGPGAHSAGPGRATRADDSVAAHGLGGVPATPLTALSARSAATPSSAAKPPTHRATPLATRDPVGVGAGAGAATASTPPCTPPRRAGRHIATPERPPKGSEGDGAPGRPSSLAVARATRCLAPGTLDMSPLLCRTMLLMERAGPGGAGAAVEHVLAPLRVGGGGGDDPLASLALDTCIAALPIPVAVPLAAACRGPPSRPLWQRLEGVIRAALLRGSTTHTGGSAGSGEGTAGGGSAAAEALLRVERSMCASARASLPAGRASRVGMWPEPEPPLSPRLRRALEAAAPAVVAALHAVHEDGRLHRHPPSTLLPLRSLLLGVAAAFNLPWFTAHYRMCGGVDPLPQRQAPASSSSSRLACWHGAAPPCAYTWLQAVASGRAAPTAALDPWVWEAGEGWDSGADGAAAQAAVSACERFPAFSDSPSGAFPLVGGWLSPLRATRTAMAAFAAAAATTSGKGAATVGQVGASGGAVPAESGVQARGVAVAHVLAAAGAGEDPLSLLAWGVATPLARVLHAAAGCSDVAEVTLRGESADRTAELIGRHDLAAFARAQAALVGAEDGVSGGAGPWYEGGREDPLVQATATAGLAAGPHSSAVAASLSRSAASGVVDADSSGLGGDSGEGRGHRDEGKARLRNSGLDAASAGMLADRSLLLSPGAKHRASVALAQRVAAPGDDDGEFEEEEFEEEEEEDGDHDDGEGGAGSAPRSEGAVDPPVASAGAEGLVMGGAWGEATAARRAARGLDRARAVASRFAPSSRDMAGHERPGDTDGLRAAEALSELRFPRDRRFRELCALLQSTQPALLEVARLPEMGDHDLIEAQQEALLLLCRRITALPLGRGMLTLSTVEPSLTRSLAAPPLELVGRLAGTGALVHLNTRGYVFDLMEWPSFHNGVAAGLRVAPASGDVARLWLAHQQHQQQFLQPVDGPEQQRQQQQQQQQGTGQHSQSGLHAGYLMALGLRGFLRYLKPTDTYEILSRQHKVTTCGLLVGLGASHLGSMEPSVSKTLCLHVPSLLPEGFDEMDVAGEVQSAATFALGLLHCGTGHRLLAEFLLAELAASPSWRHAGHREAYALSVGAALGLTMLGRGSGRGAALVGDLRLAERLSILMSGGVPHDEVDLPPPSAFAGAQSPSGEGGGEASLSDEALARAGCLRSPPAVHAAVTATGATLALAMVYLRSGDTRVAQRLAPPDTFVLLEHVRPDSLLLRATARALVLWDDVQPTECWLQAQVPAAVRRAREAMARPRGASTVSLTDMLRDLDAEGAPDRGAGPAPGGERGGGGLSPGVDPEFVAEVDAYLLAGACLGLGLRFAGTSDRRARHVLLTHLRAVHALRESGASPMCPRRSVVDVCAGVCALALGVCMAGTGDVECIRLLRRLRARTDAQTHHGTHGAIAQALGLLGLGAGRVSLSRTDVAIASLLVTCAPPFSESTNDARMCLPALRHMYVLATESRYLDARDADTGEPVAVPVEVEVEAEAAGWGPLDPSTPEGGRAQGEQPAPPARTRTVRTVAPCLLPPLPTVQRVRMCASRYWPVTLRPGSSPAHAAALAAQVPLFVRRRQGCLPYAADLPALSALPDDLDTATSGQGADVAPAEAVEAGRAGDEGRAGPGMLDTLCQLTGAGPAGQAPERPESQASDGDAAMTTSRTPLAAYLRSHLAAAAASGSEDLVAGRLSMHRAAELAHGPVCAGDAVEAARRRHTAAQVALVSAAEALGGQRAPVEVTSTSGVKQDLAMRMRSGGAAEEGPKEGKDEDGGIPRWARHALGPSEAGAEAALAFGVTSASLAPGPGAQAAQGAGEEEWTALDGLLHRALQRLDADPLALDVVGIGRSAPA